MYSRFWMELWKRNLVLLYFSKIVEENGESDDSRGDNFRTISTMWIVGCCHLSSSRHLQLVQNTSPQTPLGELTALPQLHWAGIENVQHLYPRQENPGTRLNIITI